MNGMATSMIYKYIILQVASVEIIKDGRYSVWYKEYFLHQASKYK